MSKSLSDEEQFVIESLSSALGGSWRAGEDPPDVYLVQDKVEIAIEISRLTQHVSGKSGRMESRHSQDLGVVRLCDELNEEIGGLIQADRYVILTLHAPVDRLRKFKSTLKERIIDIAGSDDTEEVSLDISGNVSKIHIVKGQRSSGKKIIGIVANRNSSTDISSNVDFILAHRIKDKTRKCTNVTHRPLWLALFNDYCLADQESYRKAMKHYSEDYPFEKIFLIAGNREVYIINET